MHVQYFLELLNDAVHQQVLIVLTVNVYAGSLSWLPSRKGPSLHPMQCS